MNDVTAAIDAIRQGEMVIVVDDGDREAEGDLVMAACHATPDALAFIIRNTCGIVCVPLTPGEAARLNLTPMVARNDAPLGTAFTISVDVTHGLTTGISAEQRCNTIRALADPQMQAQDFVRPGHVFPLISRQGGVLARAGHTEAAVDLCRLADQPPVGVICELANDDGTVMKGRQITAFAARHGIPVISVEDLIFWRRCHETLVTRSEPFCCDSVIGPLTGYAFSTPTETIRQFAFVYGDISEGTSIPARIHHASVVTDLLAGDTVVHRALQDIRKSGCGVLVYLRDSESGVPVPGIAEDMPTSERKRRDHWFEVGLGAQILRSLGVTSTQLWSSRALDPAPFEACGLTVEFARGVEPLQEKLIA